VNNNNDHILDGLFDNFSQKDIKNFYAQIEQADVLFLTGPVVRATSYSSNTLNIGTPAYELLKYICKFVGVKNWKVFSTYETPDIDEKDIETEEKNSIREDLVKAIEANPPKLIIPLSNLALVLTTKKSGIFKKRGKMFPFVGNGDIPVCPTFNIYEAVEEPSLRALLTQDIDNAYHRYVLGDSISWDKGYTLCDTEDKIHEAFSNISKASVISVDIETTGLDFVLDKITTIAISTQEKEAYVFPLYHFDSPLTKKEISLVVNGLKEIMSNISIEKVLHHCQFDIKFLMTAGITVFNNISDTKIIHSLIDENKPHGLMDLMKQFFPSYLEAL
jgi:hypothetical protein